MFVPSSSSSSFFVGKYDVFSMPVSCNFKFCVVFCLSLWYFMKILLVFFFWTGNSVIRCNDFKCCEQQCNEWLNLLLFFAELYVILSWQIEILTRHCRNISLDKYSNLKEVFCCFKRPFAKYLHTAITMRNIFLFKSSHFNLFPKNKKKDKKRRFWL